MLANGEAVGNGAFSVIVSGVGKPVAAIRAMFPEAKFSFLKIEHGPVSIEELLGTKEA